ncbi:DUF4189 domain-containing protein [Nocardia sp. NPDC051832]|uniref:DUF4189 domain-containing protein n=1 Tax=Nocardia sp. NPDC051832 TaxID=3155673 RepID=UPI00341B5526
MGKAALTLFASAAIVALGAGTAVADDGEYGSLALGTSRNDVIVGTGFNYPTQEGADVRAMVECGVSNCEILVRFRNACGAVAIRGSKIAWGGGYTRHEAEQAALAHLGPDPTSPLLISLGSARPQLAKVLASECSGTAR